jgi:hypothetical protein
MNRSVGVVYRNSEADYVGIEIPQVGIDTTVDLEAIQASAFELNRCGVSLDGSAQPYIRANLRAGRHDCVRAVRIGAIDEIVTIVIDGVIADLIVTGVAFLTRIDDTVAAEELTVLVTDDTIRRITLLTRVEDRVAA